MSKTTNLDRIDEIRRKERMRYKARIAELEAANAICRTDIEALMSSCDKLEKRNAELEAKLILLATEKEGGA